MPEAWSEDVRAFFALVLVETCFRNTFLEDLHAGIGPSSATGDYEDVKVVSPYGEIPWNTLSRISNEEMKRLMIEAVNKVYTVLAYPEELMGLGGAERWNLPQYDEPMRRVAERRAAVRQGMSEDEAWELFPPLQEEEKTRTGDTPIPKLDLGETTPARLRDLALSARVDIDWVRKARAALIDAADKWGSVELELLDAYDSIDYGGD